MRDQSLPEAEFTEHIHNSLHGRLVGHSDGRHVQDTVEVQTLGRGRRLVAGAREYHHRLSSYAFQRTFCVRCNK